jgi:hypothetical protein
MLSQAKNNNCSRSCRIAILYVVLLFACLPRATPFQTTTTDARRRSLGTKTTTDTSTTTPTRYTKLQLKASNDETTITTISDDSSIKSNNNKTKKEKKVFTVYKDDFFGFTTFLAGIGARDAVFVGIFVVLSLTAGFGTRLGWLPADIKRPYIVDRKVPGAVAGMTLALTPLLTPLIASSSILDIPEPASAARTLQLAVCSFSMITAFLDIRWRDRFDYPEEYYQKKE